MKKSVCALFGAVVLAAPAGYADLNLIDDFSTDPLSSHRWTYGVGDNSNNQFAWGNTASAFTGDSTGSLSVHLDSSLPSVRLQRGLDTSLTDTSDFHLTVQFSFNITSAPINQGVQMAFGLVNSAATGGNRTGSWDDFGGDNVFSTVEFNYFPNLSTYDSATPGPSLSPAVFGAQKGGGDAFGNFASNFSTASDLGANTTGITELPQGVTLQAALDYNGTSKLLSLTMHRINSDGTLTLLETGVPAVDLKHPPAFSNYDEDHPFVVDTLAIMAYNDGFTLPEDPSLVADMTFEKAQISTVPEASSFLLLLGGLGVLAGIRALARPRVRQISNG